MALDTDFTDVSHRVPLDGDVTTTKTVDAAARKSSNVVSVASAPRRSAYYVVVRNGAGRFVVCEYCDGSAAWRRTWLLDDGRQPTDVALVGDDALLVADMAEPPKHCKSVGGTTSVLYIGGLVDGGDDFRRYDMPAITVHADCVRIAASDKWRRFYVVNADCTIYAPSCSVEPRPLLRYRNSVDAFTEYGSVAVWPRDDALLVGNAQEHCIKAFSLEALVPLRRVAPRDSVWWPSALVVVDDRVVVADSHDGVVKELLRCSDDDGDHDHDGCRRAKWRLVADHVSARSLAAVGAVGARMLLLC